MAQVAPSSSKWPPASGFWHAVRVRAGVMEGKTMQWINGQARARRYDDGCFADILDLMVAAVDGAQFVSDTIDGSLWQRVDDKLIASLNIGRVFDIPYDTWTPVEVNELGNCVRYNGKRQSFQW